MNQLNSAPTLPYELLHEIVQLLSLAEIEKFSQVSHLARAVTLPFIFGKLSYNGGLPHKISFINQARRDTKAAIKKLSLCGSGKVADDSILFQFLESLPNLETFSYSRWQSNIFEHPSFSRLIASLQHCPLRDFEFWYPAKIQEHPTPGPPKLRRLISSSYAPEKTMGETDDQYMHLYKLVQPSFTSLVELEIHLFPHGKNVEYTPFDLCRLRPVGATLQSFVYYPVVFDPTTLDTIPEIFPLLFNLDITLRTADDSGLHWKDAYDLSLAKNLNLQFLRIYADFRDTQCQINHWSNYLCNKCASDRFEATQTLALVCRKLERSCWDSESSFKRIEFLITTDSESNERVVRVVPWHR